MPRSIDYVWTRDDQEPRPDNLALLVSALELDQDTGAWKERLKRWEAGAVVLPMRTGCYFIYFDSGGVKSQPLTGDQLLQQLDRRRDVIFSPRALSRFDSGQLSFASLETTDFR